MVKKSYDILNYDCKKSLIKIIDSCAYLEELEKANKSFKSSKILEKEKDYENYLIIFLRAIQILGNSLLLKVENLKSNEKNCQFKYLFEKNHINKDTLDELSFFTNFRNNIYYNSNSNFDEEIVDNFNDYKKRLILLKEKLMEQIEK